MFMTYLLIAGLTIFDASYKDWMSWNRLLNKNEAFVLEVRSFHLAQSLSAQKLPFALEEPGKHLGTTLRIHF